MPMRHARTIVLIFVTMLAAPLMHAQLDDQTLGKLVSVFKAAGAGQKPQAVSQPASYFSVLKPVQEGVMHGAESTRIDKQTESPSASPGATSSVSKGSVPWLFALAVEHGALTQSVDGNVITLRGNVANFIKALKVKDYIDSYNIGQDNMFVRNVSKVSFAFSFNSNSGNASPNVKTNTFSSASAHIDLYNHRDPRDSKWRQLWSAVAAGALGELSNTQGRFDTLLEVNHKADKDAWQARAANRVNHLSGSPTDKEIQDVIQAIAQDFQDTFSRFTDVRQSAEEIARSLAEYTSTKTNAISQINHNLILSLEYTYTDQSTLSLPQSSSQSFSVKTAPPNLSNINLIFATYLLANSQFTANASTNLFNSKLAGTSIGTVRDYRFSSQLDIPLPEIPSIGTSSLSFSGLFLSLLEEPLGQQVIVNTVPVSTRGNVRLFQAKWTIPLQNAGLRIPISITSSNRTELIKEKDVRGTIGISFDFDSLFSKP